jgi:hypothetical protein
MGSFSSFTWLLFEHVGEIELNGSDYYIALSRRSAFWCAYIRLEFGQIEFFEHHCSYFPEILKPTIILIYTANPEI